MQRKGNGPALLDALSRRRLLQLGVAGAALLGGERVTAAPAGGADAGAGDSLDESTVDALQARMASGEETSRSITQKYLDRIARRDGRLRSVLETNPDALAQAEALDRERKTGKVRGPLHGIPVLLRDNIATKDRMHTTAGSLAFLETTVPADAFLVGRLREAGAVLLGKTQLSEWANFRSTHSSSGWSGRGGQCRNGYGLDRSPSGSSSGSAVAVAANLCAVAVGTETDGSIVSPSAASALVGMKPTVGLVSRSGIVPIAHSQDTAGPMARTVRDAALLLEVLVGRDPADAATGAKGARFDVRYARRGCAEGSTHRCATAQVLRLERSATSRFGVRLRASHARAETADLRRERGVLAAGLPVRRSQRLAVSTGQQRGRATACRARGPRR
ncbi:MAG TPA: amidase family protein, partial [Myxococcaceae bacterium]|nr:amidase family protein [Myxococcaceae bacterium]